MMSKQTKRNLFIAFNKAMAAARRGQLEAGRVRKALGLVQKIGWQSQYSTTIGYCGCPDSQVRNMVCKHRIALMLKQRMFEYDSPYPLTRMEKGFAVAQQTVFGYHMIWIDTANTWEQVKSQYTEGKLVRPSEVHGKRLSDCNHNWMSVELDSFVPEVITY